MISDDKKLLCCLASLISDMEENGEIIICDTSNTNIVKRIHDQVLSLVPNTSLTSEEYDGIRSLLLEATSNEQFFDWEMPTITGFTSEQFKVIANKLPRK